MKTLSLAGAVVFGFLIGSVCQAETSAVESLKSYLAQEPAQRSAIAEQSFASQPLTREEAAQTLALLWEDRREQLRQERAAELKSLHVKLDDKVMKFKIKEFGDKPASGRSLVISMHGGGNAPAAVNDEQWRNQQRLYELDEGLYVAPRAPTDTWNLWHEAHIDAMLDRLIENLIVLKDVDPNRVYVTGYSAGGDGVYQLAPRMADRFAAAAMMAGHPNEASPRGLRNLPFAVHVGEKDDGFNRNGVAKKWDEQLNALHAADPKGYEYYVKLHTGCGHWMNREDAEALPWMAKHTRNPWPTKVVWLQDDILGQRFYWLAVEPESAKVGQEIIAQIDGQTIQLTAPADARVLLHLSDQLLDLDQPVQLQVNAGQAQTIKCSRTIAAQAKALQERADPTSCYCVEIAASK